MEWSEILKLAPSYSQPKAGTVVVCTTPEADLAPFDLKTGPGDLATYSHHVYKDASNEIVGDLGVYSVRKADPELITPAINGDNVTIIICVDWMDPYSWISTLDSWLAAISEVRDKVKLILCATGYNKVLEKVSSAAFDEKIDFYQQYLRTIALKNKAAAVYAMPDFDWVAFLAKEMSLPLTDRAFPEPKVVDELFVPVGWDSEAKILATGSFPFQDACNNEVTLPELSFVHEPIIAAINDKVEPLALADVLDGRESVQNLPQVQLDLEVQEDRTLDNFFDYLIDKASTN